MLQKSNKYTPNPGAASLGPCSFQIFSRKYNGLMIEFLRGAGTQ